MSADGRCGPRLGVGVVLRSAVFASLRVNHEPLAGSPVPRRCSSSALTSLCCRSPCSSRSRRSRRRKLSPTTARLRAIPARRRQPRRRPSLPCPIRAATTQPTSPRKIATSHRSQIGDGGRHRPRDKRRRTQSRRRSKVGERPPQRNERPAPMQRRPHRRSATAPVRPLHRSRLDLPPRSHRKFRRSRRTPRDGTGQPVEPLRAGRTPDDDTAADTETAPKKKKKRHRPGATSTARRLAVPPERGAAQPASIGPPVSARTACRQRAKH